MTDVSCHHFIPPRADHELQVINLTDVNSTFFNALTFPHYIVLQSTTLSSKPAIKTVATPDLQRPTCSARFYEAAPNLRALLPCRPLLTPAIPTQGPDSFLQFLSLHSLTLSPTTSHIHYSPPTSSSHPILSSHLFRNGSLRQASVK